MDYDDGFVAYLNGVEVARANIGTANSKVDYNDFAARNHEGVISSGEIPESFDISKNLSLLKIGKNVLAIEVHNNNANSSDLTAVPFLSFGQTTVTNYKESQLLDLFTHYSSQKMDSLNTKLGYCAKPVLGYI